MNRRILLAIAAIVVIVGALGFYLGMPQSAADQAMRLPLDPAPLVVETAGANAPSPSRWPTTTASAPQD